MIPQKIREVRKAAGITQTELANKLGINRATISKYETGAIDLPLSQLQHIADALNVHILDLIGLGKEFDGYKAELASWPDNIPVPKEISEMLNKDVRIVYDSLSDKKKADFLSKLAETQRPNKSSRDRVVSESEYRIVAAYRVASEADRGIIDNIVDRYAPAQSGEAVG